MELIRNSLHMNKTKGRTVFSVTIDEDIAIPEGKSGIEHKIKDMGEVCIEKIKPMEERVSVGGSLYFGILYHGSEGCQSFYSKIPFEETSSMTDISSQDIVRGKAVLYDLKISIISSHKISVRAVISIVLEAELIYEKEAVCDVDMKNVQCRKSCNNMLKIVSGKKETFRIRESVNIENDMPDISEILWQDLHIEDFEIRPGERSLHIGGNMIVFAIYKGEGKEESTCFLGKIPFSGSVEISDGRIDDIYEVDIISLEKSLIARNDVNGETRIMDGEIILTLDIHGYRNEQVDLLYDVYAPLWELTPAREEVEYETFMFNERKEFKSEERFTVQVQGKILYTGGNSVIEDVVSESDGINIIGIITADIFVESEDSHQISTIRREIPFSHKIMIEGYENSCRINARVSSLRIETRKTAQSEMTVYCTYNIDIFAKKLIKNNVITDIDYKEIPKEYIKNIPGITGYIVKSGDTLWDIAKKYNTTVDAIMKNNALESDVIYPGMKLIIVKLYCF